MNYKVESGAVGQKPYLVTYKHYFPKRPVSNNVIVFIHGAGHTMKIWEMTPDGRKGWAPIFAESGHEVIVLDWACAATKIYQCSDQEICSLTQRENMNLIKALVNRELGRGQKAIFFGWSMGGSQAFVLAADILPEKTAAILGYAATGPANFYIPSESPASIDPTKPLRISPKRIDLICNAKLFPKARKKKYIREYLVPFSPLMAAIHNKDKEVRSLWDILTVKKPENLPPTLLVNGSLDERHRPGKEAIFKKWLARYQKDVRFIYVNGFPHLGMICYGNEKIVAIYLDWLRKRNL